MSRNLFLFCGGGGGAGFGIVVTLRGVRGWGESRWRCLVAMYGNGGWKNLSIYDLNVENRNKWYVVF